MLPGFNPWVRKISSRRERQPTPVFLPGKSHGQRSLVDYSPWGRKELDMTEQLHLHLLASKDRVSASEIRGEKTESCVHKLFPFTVSLPQGLLCAGEGIRL